MQSPTRWLAHTSMTQPAGLEPLFKNLPTDVAALNRVIQGLLVHCAWLGSYGADLTAFGSISRTTLPVTERLTAMIERDERSLHEARGPTQRAVGTCRDFALTLCAFLRTMGTPARLRCGFASYFGDGWEDHWVCEYWNRRQGRWCLADPQIDQVIHDACGITFNTADMPRDVFLTAGEAWLQCRAGKSNPDQFGHEDTKGLWFIAVNVVRDNHAVNNRETSAWDRWREAAQELRTLRADELPELDRLARNPEDPAASLIPPWLDTSARKSRKFAPWGASPEGSLVARNNACSCDG